jgi:hypothetical protein
MSFDALTIGGLLAAVVSGGFLVGLVTYNDRLRIRRKADVAPRSSTAPQDP